MNSCFSIDGIGNALLHWAGYLCDVRRDAIINEGSIKYGISEFLEVFKGTNESNSTQNNYLPYVVDYQFEFKHPYYSGRRVDLMVKTKAAAVERPWIFEFKHINKDSSYQSEYCRYINDIIRLFSFHINNYHEHLKTYFMVFGKHDFFTKCFIENNQPSYEELFASCTSEQIQKGRRSKNNNFSEILNIDNDDENLIDLSRFSLQKSNNSLYIDYFENVYEKKNKSDVSEEKYHLLINHEHVSKNHIIKTRLVYPQVNCNIARQDSPIDVFIWEIYK